MDGDTVTRTRDRQLLFCALERIERPQHLADFTAGQLIVIGLLSHQGRSSARSTSGNSRGAVPASSLYLVRILANPLAGGRATDPSRYEI